MDFDPVAASGEQNYKGGQGLILNEVSLNGDAEAVETPPGSGKFVRKGGYFRKRVLVGSPKGEKPVEENLGGSVRVVFLKVRRKLVERGEKGKIIRSTNEHNHKNNRVFLYEEGREPIAGVAAALRERFEKLRTVQIVYALLLAAGEPELVRFIVRGSSLGSESKAETTTDFYKYLGSFSSNEHFYEFETIAQPVLEQGLKAYYAIDFKRGQALTPELQQIALDKLREVHEKCEAQDEARAQKFAKGEDIVEDEQKETGIEYPKDDINPDDIPF